MKFQPDHLDGVNAVSSRDSRGIAINGTAHAGSVIVPWRGLVRAWERDTHEAVTAEDIDALLEVGPEVIIYGSGPRLRFLAGAVLRPAIQARVGVECMDTAAACRTYNILVNEGRRVVAALLRG